MRRRAVFIELGKALVGEFPQAPNDVRLARPAVRAIPLLRDAGFEIVAVLHEPRIAMGAVSRQDVEAKRRRLDMAAGGRMAGFYCCPHDPGGKVPAYSVSCLCRRPQPGLITRAAAELKIDLPSSWVIGDTLDDVEAGRRAGCRTLLVDTGMETEWRVARYRIPHFLTGDMAKAARVIVAAERKSSQGERAS